MVISHSKKFIFIHNYKVAGTSISYALKKYNDRSLLISPISDKFKLLAGIYPKVYSDNFHKHVTALELKNSLSADVFNNYYKFGFVRDPWDWQVSLYSFMLKNGHHHQHDFIKSLKNFDEYIDWRVNNEVRLQKRFFYDDENNLLVNYVGKFETLIQSAADLSKAVNIHIAVPHLNKSRTDQKYLQHYTPKTIDMVYEAFYDDIKTFGYKKPEIK